jgi:hypothetical protein
MIKMGKYSYTSWSCVKSAWKDGRRGTPTGVPSLPCTQYAVGDNFLLYPNGFYRPPGDVCDLDRRATNHEASSAFRSPLYGNSYCGTLNSY